MQEYARAAYLELAGPGRQDLMQMSNAIGQALNMNSCLPKSGEGRKNIRNVCLAIHTINDMNIPCVMKNTLKQGLVG